VVGIQEVLSHLPAIRGAMRRLERVLKKDPPDLLVPIDFPDFNLRLAKRARRAGVGVVYFVSPQVWAWRRGRVHQIRRLVRRMLVLFPFETDFYEEAGVPVTFVGHPLAEKLPERLPKGEWRGRAGLDPERETIAVVPGSRRSEVDRLLAPMLGAAGLVGRHRPGTQVLVTRAPGLEPAWFEAQVAQAGGDQVRIHAGDFPEILSACDAGVVASGTACLEAAVTGLPMVVVYRMGFFSHLIGRMLVRLPHVAMPNLIADRRVVPELIQGECNPARIAEELRHYLERPEEAQRVRAELAEIRDRLGGPGIYRRAAEQVLGELGSKNRRNLLFS
jgi:lipid-A-disaccharide synthase